ncbi:unnamed protein product [Brassicogethes aeneus]|uniref:Uncharacterized protein n=1 Tax=Brassicogethes aeneus TaxID=1431903 RepID=A0A9P0BAF2_BRAAE|nr:unnamed protein product [Brassicogethes aeneus]
MESSLEMDLTTRQRGDVAIASQEQACKMRVAKSVFSIRSLVDVSEDNCEDFLDKENGSHTAGEKDRGQSREGRGLSMAKIAQVIKLIRVWTLNFETPAINSNQGVEEAEREITIAPRAARQLAHDWSLGKTKDGAAATAATAILRFIKMRPLNFLNN